MPQAPELAHPYSHGGRNTPTLTSNPSKMLSAEKAHSRALRNAGKEAFLAVVRETVEEQAVEAASQALEDELAREDEMYRRDQPYGSSSGRSRREVGMSRRSASRSHNRLDDDPPSAERRRRRSRTSSSANGEGQSMVAAAMAVFGGGKAANSFRKEGSSRRSFRQEDATAAAEVVKEAEKDGKSYKDTVDTFDAEERETLLALLNQAYSQVNELTDELKVSLDKLDERERELQSIASRPPENKLQLLSKASLASESKTQPLAGSNSGKPQPLSTRDTITSSSFQSNRSFQGMVGDEGANSTPVAVRQLQVEVQRLRQRNQQAHAKEDKYKAKEEKQKADITQFKSEISRMQRVMAMLESQVDKAKKEKLALEAAAARGFRESSGKPTEFLQTPGGTLYKEGDTKALVARVAELEEKLVISSMENATAKQEHLTAQLNEQKLEKSVEKLRHELAKSRAMNDLLQNEIDRLQSNKEPEAETDGSGWRRWLGGVQEPQPEPMSIEAVEANPIQVSGHHTDSPVIVIRDLDNDRLLYAPSRSQFA